MKSSIIRSLRDLHHIRSGHVYREERTDTPTRTDHKVDAAHELLTEQIAPRIANMSSNAVTVDRREFYYFKRRFSGRRCSCYFEENSPEKSCPICYGVGVVGGYDKFGCATEVVDYTYPEITLVNVRPTFIENPRPIYFELESGYSTGYIEARLPVRANVCKMDTFYLGQPMFNKTAKVQVFNGSVWVDITDPCEFTPYLAESSIKVRIRFNRGDKRPIVSHFYFRYFTRPSPIVIGDLSRADDNLQNSQFGIFDAYAEIPIFFASNVGPKISNEDILYRLEDKRRFRITSINENRFGNTLTSIDTQARYLIPEVDEGAFKLLI